MKRYATAVMLTACLAVWSLGVASAKSTPHAVSCADSLYRTSANAPPPIIDALRVGPVVFNHLAPRTRHDVNSPAKGDPFYSVASFFNVLTTAPRGVTIALVGGVGEVGIRYPGAKRTSLAGAPRTVRFSTC